MPDDLPVIDFTLLLQTINVKKDGVTLSLEDHLNTLLREANAAARYHKKESSLSLVLKFKPGAGNQMDVFPDADIKVPTEKPSPIPLFANKDGSLFVEDPDQRPVPMTQQFRTVRGGEGEKDK